MLRTRNRCAKRSKNRRLQETHRLQNQVDVRILRDNIDYEIFRLEGCARGMGTRLFTTKSLANSLYLLVARDFDSAQKRIPNLRKRMDAIPNVIKQAEANLQHPPKITPRPRSNRSRAQSILSARSRSVAQSGAADEKRSRAVQEKPRPRSKTTGNGLQNDYSNAPTAISVSVKKSFARNCALLSPPICRWRKSKPRRAPT